MLKTNIDQLVSILKTTSQHNVGYDEKGRLLIRAGRLSAVEQKSLIKPINDSARTPILKKQLLFPEDRVVKRSLTHWARDLSEGIRLIFNQANRYQYAAKIAEIYNNAAYICFALADLSSARELCYTQIQLFLQCSAVPRYQEHVKYIIQPWINLSRIDRMQGDMKTSIERIRLLNIPDQLGRHIGLADGHFYRSIELDRETSRLISTCSVIEPIKAYFQTSQYDAVIDFAEKALKTADKSLLAFLYEAQIIARVNVGQIDKAIAQIEDGLTMVHPGLMHLFKLRECELLAWVSNTNTNTERLMSLCRLAVDLLQAKYININDILFSLHVAYVANLIGLNEQAGQLGYFCLRASNQIGDEIVKSDCLITLYDAMTEQAGKKIIEDLMITHYYNTHYKQAKERMLRSFDGLRHVDCNNQPASMSALLDDLFNFSFA